MSQSDLLYYAQRRECELRLADEASTPEAASAHRMLAEIYLVEVKRLTSPTPRTGRPLAAVAAPAMAQRQRA